jgi:hypothetical protein
MAFSDVPIVKVEDCNRSNALQDETSQFLGIKILPLQLCGTTKEIAGEVGFLFLVSFVRFVSPKYFPEFIFL